MVEDRTWPFAGSGTGAPAGPGAARPRPRVRWGAVLTVLFTVAWSGRLPAAEVVVVTVADAIGPATADYVERGIANAARQDAALVVLRLDTPGGLDAAMRDVIRAVLASSVPVVTWVAPPGARAASAGTYILYASHVAAMAPGTNLGAATPVEIGGLPEITPGAAPAPDAGGDRAERGEPDAASDEPAAPDAGSAMHRKMVNDAVAYIRSLAELRGRNADWAERAVREAASLTADDALAAGVIDVVAGSLAELLAAIDGRTVHLGGQELQLRTQGLIVREIEPDWRARLLAVISHPNVAYVLMLLGIYGLIFELANPGYVLPGVVGAVALVLALFAFQVLPVNFAGVGLILIGTAFMVAELFVPSFGALGIGGALAFVIGSVILFDTEGADYAVSKALIGAVALLGAGFVVIVVGMAKRAWQRPVVTGREELIGAVAEVLEDFTGSGRVRAHGEIWQARTGVPVKGGQSVRVRAVAGLTLEVEPVPKE
ncbi:MAG: nodulation protein NfeD [Gammaproteobacteria bacterium]|nr:nodulation protein NfeD [Gammaproteobacteria bacterium]